MNNKLYKKLLWGTGFVIVAVILTLFIMSQTYIQNLVYHERLNQMEEVTHQMFRSLEDVIDTHWDEVNVQCNYLYYTPLKTDTEFYRYLKKLSELSNYHERQIETVCRTYLRLNGCLSGLRVIWDDITLQDEVELARARLYHAQAALLETQQTTGKEPKRDG